MVIGRAFPVPLGQHTLGVSAEQDDQGLVGIHVRRYGPDGSQSGELLSLRPTQAAALADGLLRALHTISMRR
jgi:hypothetical protein